MVFYLIKYLKYYFSWLFKNSINKSKELLFLKGLHKDARRYCIEQILNLAFGATQNNKELTELLLKPNTALAKKGI